jgi:uncharacterized protein (TIGR02118 family)
MAQVVVLYATPPDVAAFDKYYVETHLPLAKKLPGLRKFELSVGPVASPSGPSAYHQIAVLHFDDMAAVGQAMASPEGQTAAADAQTLMAEGSQLLFFETREV